MNGLKNHSCVRCDKVACPQCDKDLNMDQNYICRKCTDEFRNLRRIPTSYLKLKVRSLDGQEGVTKQTSPVQDSEDIISQDDPLSQAFPNGQGSQGSTGRNRDREVGSECEFG